MATDSIIMKKVNPSGVAPTADEIADLENAIGHKIPKSYIDLISNPEAAFPESNSFPTIMRGKFVHKDEVHEFYPFSRLIRVYREFLADDEPLWDDGPALNVNGDTDVTGYLPVAETTEFMSSGLFLKVDETQDDCGSVYYLNYSGDYNCNELVKIAPSLSDFLKTVIYDSHVMSDEQFAKHTVLHSAGDDIDELVAEVLSRRAGKKS